MNTARIVVLAIAVGAGGIAAYLASGSDPAPIVVKDNTPQLPTIEVLVAKNDLGLGQVINAEDMQWQQWPANNASTTFMRKSERPDAAAQIAGSIARSPFVAGEPIREQKLVRANGSGFMAAILPIGMRAVSTEISPETGAGGFILPNDRVDVILSKREKGNDRGDAVSSDTILSNIRVLAIDQAIEEKNGQKVVVGKTATLELRPEQSESLARARQTGTLSLALRALADANAPERKIDDNARQGSVNVVRYGMQTTTSAK